MDHGNIYSIVERLRLLEEGLDKNQKSVNQLGPTFKPKTVAVLTAKTDPTTPLGGKLVGDSVDYKCEPVEEAVATEDVLDKVKASFADYLKNVANEIKQDTDLKDKKKEDSDLKKKDKRDRDLVAKELDEDPTEDDPAQAAPAALTPQAPVINPTLPESMCVKTVTNEYGLFEIHGNEPKGFEIRHNNRGMKSRFKTLDEAEMALEMFAARRSKRDDSADYIDEA
jgi:hypothetical protein